MPASMPSRSTAADNVRFSELILRNLLIRLYCPADDSFNVPSSMLRTISWLSRGFVLYFAAAQWSICATPEPLRISAWYWLNSAPRQEWDRDFRNMAKLGFTHAALCWGLDAAAWDLGVGDTRYALESCRRAGLGAYLVVWQPVHNSLPRRPEFQQVDVVGRLRFSFDTFNPKWRVIEWKRDFDSVANLHAYEPA